MRPPGGSNTLTLYLGGVLTGLHEEGVTHSRRPSKGDCTGPTIKKERRARKEGEGISDEAYMSR